MRAINFTIELIYAHNMTINSRMCVFVWSFFSASAQQQQIFSHFQVSFSTLCDPLVCSIHYTMGLIRYIHHLLVFQFGHVWFTCCQQETAINIQICVRRSFYCSMFEIYEVDVCAFRLFCVIIFCPLLGSVVSELEMVVHIYTATIIISCVSEHFFFLLIITFVWLISQKLQLKHIVSRFFFAPISLTLRSSSLRP